MSGIRLSICIATYKRAEYIGATIASIVPQLRPGVELIVVDGASPDDTPRAIGPWLSHSGFRYYREPVNSGIDADYDKAVSYAAGEYCWLMTDDDLFLDGAVDEVLSHLGQHDLVVVNAEVRDKGLARKLRDSMLRSAADRTFHEGEAEWAFIDCADYLSFIGGVVVRRAFWLARERTPYYGTLFIHVGVLFQKPAVSRVAVIGRPLLVIRFGNAMWSARSFEIWMFKWPALIWSFEHFSLAARGAVTARHPFHSVKRLLWFRAIGGYSMDEYRQFLHVPAGVLRRVLARFIARVPGPLANFLCAAYYAFRARLGASGMELYDLERSPHSTELARRVAARRAQR